ncbi:Protein suppressor of variegation 3-7 [Lucilia cuprina]|nr:Protein suppressor of variegation 3-7 [Lucilia cuprina]
MEMNKPTAPIITVIHSGHSNLNRTDMGEMKIIEENDRQQNPAEGIDDTTKEPNKEKDDDQESVIIEEMENNTIDVEEDSGEEGERVELNNSANDSFTKATEFVIVNAAKVLAAEVADEAESTNKYPIEDVHIKDELAETITADLNSNDVLENDPMDLLEINTRSECTSSMRSQDDTEDYGDDVSSAGSSSAQTASSSSSVLDWVRDYPWLLYEEGCEQFGHCLYCDTKINIKSQRSVKQHGLSLYHKERCDNYLAFQDEEEKNGLSMQLVEIKEEFGTDSRVEALKLKRKSQSAALNNFNWRRWLIDYPWLERDSAEGTVGYCRYCLIHVNVEFSYLRDRHQEGSKHKEAEKQYEESNKSNESNQQDDVSNAIEEIPKESTADVQQKSHKWLEHLKNEPTMVRCKLCGNKMVKNNFLRHLRTNLHENNERLYLESQKTAKSKELDQRTDKYQPVWKEYAKSHPWLVPDPTDPSFAYCKYCDKRIIYGSSAAKRAVHENSSQHKLHESEFKKPSRREPGDNQNAKEVERKGDEDQAERNEDEDEEEEEQDQDGDNDDDDDDDDNEAEVEEETNDDEAEDDEEDEADEEDESQQAKESADENDSKKRIYRLTEEWINQYSWCRRYNKDPTNYFFCIYCRIPLRAKSSRSKHQTTSIHISAEKEYLSRQVKRQKFQERKQGSENSTFFEWAIPLRNNPNSYSCRYCRVRISKNYSKKQHASSKIHQINESIYKNNRRKSVRKDENSNSSQQTSKVVTKLTNVATSKKGQTFAKVVIKAPSTVTLIKQWQKKFPWLTYKRSELRSNYGHCKMCESSLFIRSLKHVLRHVRSPKHVNMTKAKKKEKLEKEQEEARENGTSAKIDKKGPKEEVQSSPPPNESSSQNQTTQSTSAITESPKAINYKSTIAELKKRFSWIEKSESPNYAYCHFCNTNIPIKILFLRNHSNSLKHRHCVVNYNTIGGKKTITETQGQNNAESDNENDKGDNDNDMDDDVMIVEENNEEILISEQDENWAVKSETMDEHEELDYLLQRSFNNSQNKSNTPRNVRKHIAAVDENPPTKRIKRSQSFRRLNDSNTSLVASLLTTPLTLASCLGPLIQQQIQQQANIAQTPLSTTAAPEIPKTSSVPQNESANTYDLFFKSISETMKKLPVDLAAEGKFRVMQIICELELQAHKRQQNSQPNESSSSNNSGGGISQATSTSTSVLPPLNSSSIHDHTTEQNGNSSETNLTQLNVGADVLPTSAVNLLPLPSINPPIVENPVASTDTSPIIGVMDKNGLQTIQLKTSVAKQIPRSTTSTTVTSVSNSGIRCIPFKNLSQATTPDANNTKVTRIQVPLNVAGQPPNPNVNTVNNSKSLLNFRNIQITKRIATPPTSTATSISGQPLQQTASKPTAVNNKSPQRTYITNIQPQMQRWSCSVNGATTPHHTPTSSAVNHLQQLSSQQTSTPISKKH